MEVTARFKKFAFWISLTSAIVSIPAGVLFFYDRAHSATLDRREEVRAATNSADYLPSPSVTNQAKSNSNSVDTATAAERAASRKRPPRSNSRGRIHPKSDPKPVPSPLTVRVCTAEELRFRECP